MPGDRHYAQLLEQELLLKKPFTSIFKLIKLTVAPLLVLANLPYIGLYISAAMQKQLTPELQTFLPNQDGYLEHFYNFLPSPYFGNFWKAAMVEDRP